ncbi:uncharacterized protein N7511_011558 [Penicillium nucicola]|uniref:uncharacterized protein n=1 Tax=Penicillium nucicola TaxID=1850975 RepID=UPI00254545E2|nr:uncharacterized protein N7511_011558 [Penicillium nucicola]KAJ5741213.1 hypothetical protein N7511_011558 [Penicillium nucicola]
MPPPPPPTPPKHQLPPPIFPQAFKTSSHVAPPTGQFISRVMPPLRYCKTTPLCSPGTPPIPPVPGRSRVPSSRHCDFAARAARLKARSPVPCTSSPPPHPWCALSTWPFGQVLRSRQLATSPGDYARPLPGPRRAPGGPRPGASDPGDPTRGGGLLEDHRGDVGAHPAGPPLHGLTRESLLLPRHSKHPAPSTGHGSSSRQPRTNGPGSPLHRLTDPIWGIEIHATVNGASFGSWGTLLLGRGPCHPVFPYKVGHFSKTFCVFLRTWSSKSQRSRADWAMIPPPPGFSVPSPAAWLGPRCVDGTGVSPPMLRGTPHVRLRPGGLPKRSHGHPSQLVSRSTSPGAYPLRAPRLPHLGGSPPSIPQSSTTSPHDPPSRGSSPPTPPACMATPPVTPSTGQLLHHVIHINWSLATPPSSTSDHTPSLRQLVSLYLTGYKP